MHNVSVMKTKQKYLIIGHHRWTRNVNNDPQSHKKIVTLCHRQITQLFFVCMQDEKNLVQPELLTKRQI